MALSLRVLCRLNVGLVNNVFSKTNTFNVGARYIFTEKALGVNTYELTRTNYRNQFATIESTFRMKMKEICDSNDGVIFTEDLKAMLHLTDKSPEDIQLIGRMISRYQEGNHEMKFGSYVFGTVVMRMYYYLNEPKIALTTFKNCISKPFYRQRSSFSILMCLLYNNEMYQEARDLFECLIQEGTWNDIAKYSLLELSAICYKEGTVEAYQYALSAWKILSLNLNRSPARSTSLLAAMALKHGSPSVALELLSVIQKQHYVTIRCLKLLAYMHLKKYELMIPLFKGILDFNEFQMKQTLCYDVIDELEKNLQENVDCESVPEVQRLLNELRSRNHVSSASTLEENLLRPKTSLFRKLQIKDAMGVEHEREPFSRNEREPFSRNEREPFSRNEREPFSRSERGIRSIQ